MRPFASMLLVLLAAIPAAGCAVSQPDVPVRRYLDGDFEHVRAFAEQESVDGAVENLALVLSVQGQCELPILALTANVLPADREACKLAGMDDFLPKPVKLDLLRSAIQRWTRECEPAAARP